MANIFYLLLSLLAFIESHSYYQDFENTSRTTSGKILRRYLKGTLEDTSGGEDVSLGLIIALVRRKMQ